MNWPLIGAAFVALAVVGELLSWLSGIRKGKSSETGEPELLFPLLSTGGALTLAIWLTLQRDWHWLYIYILPALALGAALAALNQGGTGEGIVRLLSGAIWPFGVVMILRELLELQERPPWIKAYDIAKRGDWGDPAHSGASQVSFKWNASNVYKLKTGRERVFYLRAKMHIAQAEHDRQIRHARYYTCADLVHEIRCSPDLSQDLRDELTSHFEEALRRYREF